MNRYLLVGAMLAAFVAGCSSDDETTSAPQATTNAQAAGPEHHKVFQPSAIEWQQAPPGLPPGAQVAVLQGNPNESGYFVMRIKVPDGYRVPPHFHPNAEGLTVISGGFFVGTGEESNWESMQPVEVGSYIAVPAASTHYVRAQGETIIQNASMGPFGITYVNPDDDPRPK
ncbi:cupin domain-containing protein [Nocardia sp. GCM10030253]|uniref:cupin domain-containing protein n=1 Tax=Nocardia sp. GCM10030253 TaxID=3273404 RepID=UPI00363F022E